LITKLEIQSLEFVVSSYFFHPHAHRAALISLVKGALTFGLYESRNNISNQQCPLGKKLPHSALLIEKQ
jgi:hypothetical protein